MVELVTLGSPTVLRDRTPLPVSPRSAEFLLLVRLTLHGPASPRELGRFLWPERLPEEQLELLDRAMERIRELAGSDAIRAEEEGVEVDPGRVTTDVERFREAIAGDRHRDALALYRGHFLEEMEFGERPAVEAWVEETRRTLAGMARRARDQVPWGDDAPEDLWPRIVRKIRSRRVVHVAILYLGFAWGSFEVAVKLVDAGFFGSSLITFVTAFHAMGFPVAVAAAWLLEARRRQVDAGPETFVLGRTGLRFVHLVAAVAVLALGSGLAWAALEWGGAGSVIVPLRAELPEEKHLAVLPFLVLGDDPLTRELADGLVETLISHLTSVEGLRGEVSVVSSADIRGREVRSPSEARDLFGVNLGVTGSVGVVRDSVHVTVNLVDAVRGRQFDSFLVEESAANLNRLQRRILDGLQGLLALELETSEEASLASGWTESPQAYGLQVRARGFLHRYERVDNLDRALELFREALGHDPDYVLALAGVAEAYLRRYDRASDPADLERAREAVLHALDLDDQMAQVHVTLGMVYHADGRHEQAERAFHRALALEPRSVDALLGLGRALRELGRSEEAERAYLEARDVRLGDWRIHNYLGVLYYHAGRYEEAALEFRRVVELHPDHVRGWTNLGAAHLALGNAEEAAEYLERSVAIAPTDQGWANLAYLYYYQVRDYERAAELYERALALNDRSHRNWYNLASAYNRIPGQEERARAAYRATVERARDAQELNPRDPDIPLTLAAAHAQLDDPNRARLLLRRALELAPDDLEVLFRAGDVFETLGEREEARRLIAEAVNRGYSWETVELTPGLEDLRADPTFLAAVGRNGSG